jgi:hypothetical protein
LNGKTRDARPRPYGVPSAVATDPARSRVLWGLGKKVAAMKKFVVLSVVGMLALAWSLVSPGTAEAAKAKKKGDPEAMFKKLDADNDGKLTKEEFAKIGEVGKKPKAAKPKKIDQMFSKLDTNNDGSLSLEEFKKLSEVKGKKKAK